MAKKNEEKTVEKKTYTVEEELEMLLRSIDASLKTLVAFLPKEQRVIPGLTPPPRCGRVLTADNEGCVLPVGHVGGCTIYAKGA